ncbi:MAG: lysine--tRNA ligase [Candidatus Doudnabacteria bacterium RIFCSPLOWO2_01_FULL_44_21]|uniref:Lysine--tRNA ligase n=1 Tax=Candidatus Doudnabacteria bacterium RIFCSPLOWO2_01_FULL_44_21 TaxID=1817841 RepID=A0A1F5PX49_9BACT|nr:MAG: lysine--tRNA ligase [Candidatus Doudnabacteria bacterium RIFCSPHIGHO2_02_FULL_43_13b]OGE94434.1 MAG: lysine--tRNA ligase [Candidatus Doudnabacteria bacterium RIFCSPLOWO2_01_FULL_44_21]
MSEKIEELRQVRLQKLVKLKKAGIDPFPVSSNRTHTIAEAIAMFGKQEIVSSKQITLAGRIRSIRTHGKLTFGNLEDHSGTIQFLLRADVLGEQFKLFSELFDMGDFIQVTGNLALSKTGEKTLETTHFSLLTKSLRPIPQNYFGLKDLEVKLRQRYLDLVANPETRELFRKKAIFWKSIRDFLESNGFIEVEMNVLEQIPGGAEAEPFITHHNALNRDFYLRISLELPLKKLLVGGFEKVFEIGRIFRNEGISTEHLQDYMQMEFYWAYADYEQLMDLTQDLYQQVVKNVTGGLKTTYDGKEIDWGAKWPKVKYFNVFKDKTGLDLNVVSDDELRKYAKTENIKVEKNFGRGRVVDLIFKKKVRPSLVQPTFLVNPPVEIEPLAKKDPKNPKEVQRMQIMAGGTELGKGFSELNDPIDQRERFEDQMKLRDAGDKEAQMLDEDFVEALEYGMPPAAGFGLSERLFSVIMDKSIRETVFFPPMKEE